jgi:hypothetical protein
MDSSCVRQYSRERAGAQRLREDASINTSRQIDVALFMDNSIHLKSSCIPIACREKHDDVGHQHEQLIHTAVLSKCFSVCLYRALCQLQKGIRVSGQDMQPERVSK